MVTPSTNRIRAVRHSAIFLPTLASPRAQQMSSLPARPLAAGTTAGRSDGAEGHRADSMAYETLRSSRISSVEPFATSRSEHKVRAEAMLRGPGKTARPRLSTRVRPHRLDSGYMASSHSRGPLSHRREVSNSKGSGTLRQYRTCQVQGAVSYNDLSDDKKTLS